MTRFMQGSLVARTLFGCMVVIVCLASGCAIAQPAWPTHSVRLVIAGSPGSGADVVARLVAESLSQRLGQTFVPDNRSGANGALATRLVARAVSYG